MTLNTLWFLLIALLFSGYFFLEGFDFGVGMLVPFLGKNDVQRRVIVNTIGPHWDGNEVWLITAGGALFAAFPMWYATLFSGFYLPLFLILLVLIVRGVAIEFRSRIEDAGWRKGWDWALCVSSFLAPLLWGVAFANLVRGVPIDANMNYVGGFWNLLNPYALLGGVTFVALFLLHGAIFLTLTTEGSVHDRAIRAAQRFWPFAAVLLLGFLVYSIVGVGLAGKPLALGMLGVGFLAVMASLWAISTQREGWAFGLTAITVLMLGFGIFAALYPNVMISSLNPAWNLTITNSASGPYTLHVMSIVAAVLVPIVLAYQGWSYWVFRKRIGERPEELHY